jgi:hypothetical protein
MAFVQGKKGTIVVFTKDEGELTSKMRNTVQYFKDHGRSPEDM